MKNEKDQKKSLGMPIVFDDEMNPNKVALVNRSGRGVIADLGDGELRPRVGARMDVENNPN